MPLASALPWRKILTALPYVVATADKARKALSSRSEPPVDPTADLKTQLAELAKRVHDNEVAQAEQAKVVAEIAEQLEAVANRAARGYRLAWAAFAIACVALVLAGIAVFR
jgi:hypothetical protein